VCVCEREREERDRERERVIMREGERETDREREREREIGAETLFNVYPLHVILSLRTRALLSACEIPNELYIFRISPSPN
jgi:hypothetical protein